MRATVYIVGCFGLGCYVVMQIYIQTISSKSLKVCLQNCLTFSSYIFCSTVKVGHALENKRSPVSHDAYSMFPVD